VNIHKNARLAPAGRLDVARRVHAGEPVAAVALAVGVSRQTVYKWMRRIAEDGAPPRDRPSRPHH
jgi:transposase-like protein